MALAGCTIIDQRTFRADSSQPGPTELARAALPALPLITVRFDTPIDQPAIASAVDLARARRPDATFDVIAPIPAATTQSQQAAALAQGRQDAETVATALAEAGVPRARIELGARPDGIPGIREIRVYVR